MRLTIRRVLGGDIDEDEVDEDEEEEVLGRRVASEAKVETEELDLVKSIVEVVLVCWVRCAEVMLKWWCGGNEVK